jgi:GMP synthase-like glutamine amidotransferase
MVKAAIIDLYNNEKNEGIRCIKEIVSEAGSFNGTSEISYDLYETRYKGDVPGFNYDIYVSSGGPGSPFADEGKKWEKDYFNLLSKIWDNNQKPGDKKKYIFFICHSFQMMGRFFKFAEVTKRNYESFGIFPFIKTQKGKEDPILKELTNPLYAADFRKYQVVNPDKKVLKELGGEVIALEEEHTREGKEPGIMAVRLSNEIAGTQFHPEADPKSMMYHFSKPERKKHIIEKYGEEKYSEMIDMLEDPGKIQLTRKTVLPTFLRMSIDELNHS